MPALAYHAAIHKHLASLAELDEMIGPNDLICGWFDHLYFPAEETCPSGYPLVTWEAGQREWRECFTAGELAILADFHRVFASCVDQLPLEWPQWHKDSGWLKVCNAAKVALANFPESRPNNSFKPKPLRGSA